jgi:mono/diheme cytochrome c family protein
VNTILRRFSRALICLVAGLILADARPAAAVPAFSRKYQTSCQTCHAIFPKLNPFGEAFRLNGYRMPLETAEQVKQKPVSLGAEAYERIWPEMVWPSDLPASVPFALNTKMANIYSSSVDDAGHQVVHNDFQFPQEANLFAAGTLGKNFSFFGEFTWAERPDGGSDTEIEHARLDVDFGRRTDLDRTLPAWLAAKIDSPRSFAQGLRMPSYEFNGEDTRAVVTALLSLASQPVPEPYRFAASRAASLVPGGPVGALIDRYRCLSCHRIGEEGGDTSTAPLTFEGSKVQREWLIDYLTLSYSLRPILEERMPVLRMPREEAVQLADAFESFSLDRRIPEDPFSGRPASDADTIEGQKLYASLGCRACHIVGSSGGYYGPPLTDTGKRLKSGWVYAWLKGPQRWRADVRCPNYGLTDTDALRLTAYLGTLRSEPAPAPAGGAQ